MERRLDVFAMCNALMDIQVSVTPEDLNELGLKPGSMGLVDDLERERVLARYRDRQLITASGGSGANTAVGVCLLGGSAAFTSAVGDDDLGRAYTQGISAAGVVPRLQVRADAPTGTSIVQVLPDGERTMCTHLGAGRHIEPDAVDTGLLAQSRLLYITGYLWDTDRQKAAVEHAMRVARAAGVRVAFSLSDPFCVNRHHDAFRRLVDELVDVVFSNAEEAMALTGAESAQKAVEILIDRGVTAVVTDGPRGAWLARIGEVVHVPAEPVQPVDTTGAGDVFAAGVLYGMAHDFPLKDSGRLASFMAGHVISSMGPRLNARAAADVRQLAAEMTGRNHRL